MIIRTITLVFGLCLAYFSAYSGDALSVWAFSFSDWRLYGTASLTIFLGLVAAIIGMYTLILVLAKFRENVDEDPNRRAILCVASASLLFFAYGCAGIPFSSAGSFWASRMSYFGLVCLLAIAPIILLIYWTMLEFWERPQLDDDEAEPAPEPDP